MIRYLLPLIVMVVLIGYFAVGLQSDPSELPSQFIDKPAPQFSLSELSEPSLTVTTADLQGQVGIVNIWATWCVGCRAEHQFLNELAARGDVPIYGINWRDNRQDALQWLAQLGNPYQWSGFDGDGRIGIEWGVYGAPETFLISPQGKVLYRFTGPLSWPLWEQEFVPRIAMVEAQ